MQTLYPASIVPGEGGYFVQFADLPEAFSDGETMEEALFNAAEVLTLTLKGRIAEGMAVPEPSRHVPDAHYIAPDAKTQAALLLRAARGEKSHAELARALSTSWDVAKRLEDPNHWPNLKSLDRAAAALGKRLLLTLE
ncbi:MAG: type II toxin-antitoxin system HicB family antitoxin [Candidatus Accumulibacter sp.]|jgi:antitoxin HicB|nr:type II toxin-antitoxin system HicB family antitoxin [Accumulibacter sp.]